MKISYILPIKWSGHNALDEMTAYLKFLSPHVELIVVDGSEVNTFKKHHQNWSSFARHIAPYPDLQFSNGKVNGVLTGLQEASHEHVIFADDDVRYTLDQLEEISRLLIDQQLIIPQNYFSPCPWHAHWDTSRSLLNRVFGHDYPGTLAVQGDFLQSLGGYDGNVLFENLELIRTIKAGDGPVLVRNDLYIRRLPPSARHFWSQRVRQAYDDYAQPARLFFFILLLPLSIIAAFLFSPWLLAGEAVLAILMAEIGRRKYEGTKVFDIQSSLFAPFWLLERGICTWIALFEKLTRGGVEYNNSVITTAANSISKIRHRIMGSIKTSRSTQANLTRF